MKLFAKSPTEMCREAEARGKPKPRMRKPGVVDPAKRPLLDGATFSEYLRTGLIEAQ